MGALVLAAMLLLWLGTAATPVQANPDTRHVAPPPTGGDAGNDCIDPGSPCATIQHAIDVANPGDEILVAGGTYSPGGTVATITKELDIIGAFDPAFNASDPDTYETVLDADWGGSVISITNASTVVLELLTLTHGDGTGNCVWGGCGGGIYATGTSLHVGHCVITDNMGSKAGDGGGIYAFAGHVDVRESRIVSNTATIDASSGSRGQGGGMRLISVTHVKVLRNVIRGNSSNPAAGLGDGYGGGISMDSSDGVYVAGNRIEDNLAKGGGGGIYSDWSDVHFARNTIISNTSAAGDGIYIRATTPVTLTNNLIARNYAIVRADGVFVVGSSLLPSQAILINNTVVANGPLALRGGRTS